MTDIVRAARHGDLDSAAVELTLEQQSETALGGKLLARGHHDGYPSVNGRLAEGRDRLNERLFFAQYLGILSGPFIGNPLHDGEDRLDIDLVRKPDRKSTRLNSSHVAISYAVFCLKKKQINR